VQAFISYQTADKKIAGEIKEILKAQGIESFLAHEDIDVSDEWRTEILNQIRKAKVFVAVITRNYEKSVWCVQESGIAAARKSMVSICLLLDDATPPGFLRAVQGRPCKNGKVELVDMLPGLVKALPGQVLDGMIDEIRNASRYRWAESDYEKIMPYIEKLSNVQAKRLLEVSKENGQVGHASRCIREYIPKVMKIHGHLLDEEARKEINDLIESYRQ
jgi:hypothetical protein